MIVADYFYPRHMPAESAINTRFVQELQKTGAVFLWTEIDGRLPTNGSQGRIVGNVQYWGFRTLLRIWYSIWSYKPKYLYLMYDSGAYSGRPWIALLPALVRMSTRNVKVATHFTNELSVPLSRIPKGVLRRLAKLGLSWLDDNILSFGASHRLIFYCKYHRDVLVGSRPELKNKSEIIEVPPTIHKHEWTKKNISDFRRRFGIPSDTPLICYLGMIYANKGVDVLLQASAILSRRQILHKIIIVNSGKDLPGRSDFNTLSKRYRDYLVYLCDELGITPDTLWLEDLSDEDVSLALTASDVAVLPFQRGVMANNSSFVSCLAHGLPTITTLSQFTDPFLRNCKGVTFVSPQEPEELASAITACITDENRKKQSKSEIQKLMSTHFSWESFIKRMRCSELQVNPRSTVHPGYKN